MLSQLLTQNIQIVTQSYNDATLDEYGNPTPDKTTIDVLGYVQEIGRAERAGYVPEATDLLIVPTGLTLTADDVVIDDLGLTYQVIGPPSYVRNPRLNTVDHIEATLKRSAGGVETP